MISLSTEDEIRELRSDGMSYRKIAAALGVSRQTVGNVLSDPQARSRIREVDMDRRAARKQANALVTDFHPVAPHRCGGCGAVVYVAPCPACKARAALRVGNRHLRLEQDFIRDVIHREHLTRQHAEQVLHTIQAALAAR